MDHFPNVFNTIVFTFHLIKIQGSLPEKGSFFSRCTLSCSSPQAKKNLEKRQLSIHYKERRLSKNIRVLRLWALFAVVEKRRQREDVVHGTRIKQ